MLNPRKPTSKKKRLAKLPAKLPLKPKRTLDGITRKKKSSNSSKTTPPSTESLPTFRFVSQSANQDTDGTLKIRVLPQAESSSTSQALGKEQTNLKLDYQSSMQTPTSEPQSSTSLPEDTQALGMPVSVAGASFILNPCKESWNAPFTSTQSLGNYKLGYCK